MACCGQRRQQIRRTIPVQPANTRALASDLRRPSGQLRTTAFQYVGKTALTVMGPSSGWYYRFTHPGAIVEVHPGDRASLAAIPSLRQVQR